MAKDQFQSLAGKVAVITGSGRQAGLGAAIAQRLASDGAKVVISDQAITAETNSLVETMRSAGLEVSALACDVTNLGQVQALGQYARDQYGSLDIWVNNAGIGFIMKPLLEVTVEDWSRVIDVNLTGAIATAEAAVELFRRQGHGQIVGISSIAGVRGMRGKKRGPSLDIVEFLQDG